MCLELVNNIADNHASESLTKPLGKIAFERLRDDLTGYLAFNKPLAGEHPCQNVQNQDAVCQS